MLNYLDQVLWRPGKKILQLWDIFCQMFCWILTVKPLISYGFHSAQSWPIFCVCFKAYLHFVLHILTYRAPKLQKNWPDLFLTLQLDLWLINLWLLPCLYRLGVICNSYFPLRCILWSPMNMRPAYALSQPMTLKAHKVNLWSKQVSNTRELI